MAAGWTRNTSRHAHGAWRVSARARQRPQRRWSASQRASARDDPGGLSWRTSFAARSGPAELRAADDRAQPRPPHHGAVLDGVDGAQEPAARRARGETEAGQRRPEAARERICAAGLAQRTCLGPSCAAGPRAQGAASHVAVRGHGGSS